MKEGLTQSQLANKTNYSVSYISDIEVGRTIPTIKTLELIATSLGVHISSFLGSECCKQRIRNQSTTLHGNNSDICQDCPLFQTMLHNNHTQKNS